LSAARAGIVLGLALLAACADFPVENQSDARYPLSMTINAPDTVYTFGDTIGISLTTTPQWDGSPTLWSSDPTTAMKWLDNERMVVNLGTYAPTPVTITAKLGSHHAERTVIFKDVVTSLKFWVWNDSLVFADTVRLQKTNFAQYLIPAPLDSGGTPVTLPSGMQVAVISRNPNIATWAATDVMGIHTGQTWLVGTIDAIVDSVLVIVP